MRRPRDQDVFPLPLTLVMVFLLVVAPIAIWFAVAYIIWAVEHV